jgi:site-specific DNA recombinase
MVEDGHVSNVLVWRLDRLSRNLGDLILLADTFGSGSGVSLHSFTERIDLSSATGRMFYNVLGSFAQFYREQLAENVTMGTERAMREGRWCNRPPTGYDLDDGLLVPTMMRPRVQAVFRLRGEGAVASGDRRTHRDQLLDGDRHPCQPGVPRRDASARASGGPDATNRS